MKYNNQEQEQEQEEDFEKKMESSGIIIKPQENV